MVGVFAHMRNLISSNMHYARCLIQQRSPFLASTIPETLSAARSLPTESGENALARIVRARLAAIQISHHGHKLKLRFDIQTIT